MSSSDPLIDSDGLLRFLSFESRRADEMRSLIRRFGGVPTVVASMREIPLEENAEAFQFANELLSGRVDAIVFLTGVGAETLIETLKHRHDSGEILKAIDSIRVAVRGPKPTAVLRKWGVHIDVKAPEPNTWRETAEAIRNNFDLEGKTVAVQEYGKPNEAFYDELRSFGATILRVPVYRWALPEDTTPLEQILHDAVKARFDVYAFTSAQQVENVLTVAENLSIADQLADAMRSAVIVSIGPTCSEALRSHGLDPDLEASPPKMGPMVRLALDQAPSILDQKARRRSNGLHHTEHRGDDE